MSVNCLVRPEKMRSAKIFLLAGLMLCIEPASYAHCAPQPDIYGELEIDTCAFKTEGNTKGVLAKQSSSDPKGSRTLPKNKWGVLLVGKIKKIRQIQNRKTKLEPRIVYSSNEKKKEYDKISDVVTIETAYKTEDLKFCSSHGKGTKIFVDLFFLCCDSPSAYPPCGFGTSWYTENVSGTNLKKYENP